MDDMSVQKMGKLLSDIRKARFEELKRLKTMWPNPTPKQAKKIAKAQEAYNEIRAKQVQFKKLKNLS